MRDYMRYVNHLGEEIEFGKGNILINENDFRNYQWNYNSKPKKIYGFNRGSVQKTLPVIVFGKNARETADILFEIIEKDVIAEKTGKMYIGDYYVAGYFVSTNHSGYTKQNSIDLSLKFVAEDGVWVKEEKKQFYPQSEQNNSIGLNFPSDFAFDFATGNPGNELWNVEHFAPSHFKMIIYGPCVNPRVLVNGYPYQIFAELESSDYLILDSRKNTVAKYLANGTTANLYNSRQFTPSVFEKIPGGQLNINWQGNFGFDITLYLERSEPKW